MTGLDNLAFCGALYGLSKTERLVRAKLLLDEPTTGIDVASARAIRQRLATLHASGTTILLTTHYIEVAERLCTRVAFLVKGRILRVDSVSDLLEPVRGIHAAVLSLSGSGDVCELLAGAFPGLRFDSVGPGRVRAEGTESFRGGPIVRFLEERGVEVEEARKVRPSIEDVFVRITGLSSVLWSPLLVTMVLISVSCTFLGLFVAVSVSEVFEAQTFSNFFRFPMVFLCGLFFPIGRLPLLLRPISYVLPLTYGSDALRGTLSNGASMPLALDFAALAGFCAVLFAFSVRNVRRKWMV